MEFHANHAPTIVKNIDRKFEKYSQILLTKGEKCDKILFDWKMRNILKFDILKPYNSENAIWEKFCGKNHCIAKANAI